MSAQSFRAAGRFSRGRRFFYAFVLGAASVGLLAAWSGMVAAQTNEAAPPSETPTIEAVQQRLKQIDEATNLDDPTKAQIRELLQKTFKDLESAASLTASAKQYEEKAASAAGELQNTKTELDALPRQHAVSVPEASLTQLEQELSEKTARFKAEKTELAELEAEPKRRADRRAKLPKLAVALREQLAEVNTQLQAVAAVENPAEIDAARRWSLLARRQAIENELLSNEKELDNYEKRSELLPLRRDLVAGRVALAERELAAWREAVDRQRRLEADAQAAAAQAAAAQAHPAIKSLTEQNAKWAKRRQELVPLIAQTAAQLEAARQSLATLQERVKRIKEKVDIVGQTSTIGQLLRKEREAIPDFRAYRNNVKTRQPIIAQCQLELLDLEDRRSQLSNLDAEIRNHLKTAPRADYDGSPRELEAAARQSLQTEKEYVGVLANDLNRYVDQLFDLGMAEELLTREAADYVKYIDERVLWIHSTSPLYVSSVEPFTRATAWLTRPESWLRMGTGFLGDVAGWPLPGVIALLVFAPLVWNQRRLRRKTSDIGDAAARANCCSIVPTIEATLVTMMLAAVVPGILWYVAWRLSALGAAVELAEPVATGLAYTAGIFLMLELMQQMCRPGGLSEAHFDWPASALKPVRNYARMAKLVILPCAFVSATMASQPTSQWSDSLGRFGFVVAMVACGVLVQQSLRHSGAIYQAMLAAHHDSPVDRLRLLWYPLAVFVPLALAALAAVGYYYTAQQLAGRMVATVCILFGLVFLRSFLLRWILVNRRRLAIQQARARRAAAGAEAKQADEAAGSSEMPTPPEPTLDLATINVQTRYLVKYSLAIAGLLGIWVVWVDVLPALRILDGIVLWNGATQSDPTSLADLFLAVLTFATTAVAARNAPGLLELALLQGSKLDASFRYTVGAISRYVIVVVGLLVGCHVLGLTWGTVQWLVAAVSVGLGFGLQEIFANFVSGIIILFERPVRVGDVVTIGETTGVVSRIRMRATTITNWDRQEFIVPNREFITGRLLNWTLSDQVNRIVLKLGIAYGSDTQLATEILTKIVREHPLILGEPTPRVTFEEFGQSALNYVVRCYLPDMENRLAVIHDLHTSIDLAFREAGIEIAFPQQDIHIRSIHANLESIDAAAGPLRRPELVRDEDDTQQPQNRHVA